MLLSPRRSPVTKKNAGKTRESPMHHFRPRVPCNATTGTGYDGLGTGAEGKSCGGRCEERRARVRSRFPDVVKVGRVALGDQRVHALRCKGGDMVLNRREPWHSGWGAETAGSGEHNDLIIRSTVEGAIAGYWLLNVIVWGCHLQERSPSRLEIRAGGDAMERGPVCRSCTRYALRRAQDTGIAHSATGALE